VIPGMHAETSPTISVYVDPDLADLVPAFLENRGRDIEKIKAATDEGDYQAIRKIGHDLKGVGGGYGFDRITELGAMIEAAAADADGAGVLGLVEQLADYLQRVEVVFRQA